MAKKITICVPCYNEEANVISAYKAIKAVTEKIKGFRFEYIFVDNGSLDKTRSLIRKIARQDKRVMAVFLSRNFGPEASGQAAYDAATGDAVMGLACDLQDPPELIPQFIKKWQEGYDIVWGAYKRGVDGPVMTWLRRNFYRVFKTISTIDVPTNVTGFGLIDKKVILALRSLPEKYRFGRGLAAWVGFKKTFIPYEKRRRERGKSSYSFIDYIKAAERGVFGFSYLPLDFITYVGFILMMVSFLFIFAYLVLFFLYGNPIKGSVTILVSIIFFGGIQLFALSIIGKYILIIVEEVKARPTYIIEEVVNGLKK